MKREKRGKIEKFWIVFVLMILITIPGEKGQEENIDEMLNDQSTGSDFGSGSSGGISTGPGSTTSTFLTQTPPNPPPSRNRMWGCSGQMTTADEQETVCTVQYDAESKTFKYRQMITATEPGLLTHTRVVENSLHWFLEFISIDNMPNKEEGTCCNNLGAEDQSPTIKTDTFGEKYYSYDCGSNIGWIVCKVAEGPLAPWFNNNFDPQTKITGCENNNPHVRSPYDRVVMNSRFIDPDRPDAGEPGSEDIQNIVAASVPLMQTGYTVDSGEGTPAGSAGDGGVSNGGGSSRIEISPEFLCFRRDNIGFWAGCGATFDETQKSHNFYPGGMPTTFKDFGTSMYGDGEIDVKPGSKYIYNNVLALGVSQITGGSIKYGWTHEVNDRIYGAEEEFFYDWNDYDKLIFYFKAARLPQVYKIYFKSMKGSGANTVCSELSKKHRTSDFVQNIKPNKWYKIEIPRTSIGTREELSKMCGMGIKADQSEMASEGGENLLKNINFPPIPNELFFDLVFLDRFTLISEGSQPRYCAYVDTFGNSEPDVANWITNLNENAQVCNEQPSYIWTGTRCCGDSDETYIDTANDNPYACWEGEAKANDELVDVTVKTVNMYCRTREGNCLTGETPQDKEIAVLRLSSLTSAHGATLGNFPYSVCCRPQEGTLAASGTTILKLSDTINAHASTPSFETYTTNVNLQLTGSSGKKLNCSYEYDDPKDGYDSGYTICKSKYDTCLVSISSENNPTNTGGVHLESCDNKNYPYKLCCKIQSATE